MSRYEVTESVLRTKGDRDCDPSACGSGVLTARGL